MAFENYLEQFSEFGGIDLYFKDLLQNGIIREPEDIILYIQEAYNEGLKDGKSCPK